MPIRFDSGDNDDDDFRPNRNDPPKPPAANEDDYYRYTPRGSNRHYGRLNVRSGSNGSSRGNVIIVLLQLIFALFRIFGRRRR